MLEVNQSQSKYWLYFLPFVNIRKQIIYCMLSHFLCFYTLTHDTVMRAFEHVSFSYDKRKIIDDVSLSIPQRTTTAIVGPSGGGKSTLCNLIARFWDVDAREQAVSWKLK